MKKPIKYKIGLLPTGLVMVRGKLKTIDTITSPISKSKCIGYHYSELLYTPSKTRKIRTLEEKKESSAWRAWKSKNSKSKCNDFFIEDTSGKIRVIAKGITIAIIVNQHEKNITNDSKDIEYLLLEDDTEYVLVGKVTLNDEGEKVIKKNKNQFFISDISYYNLTNNNLISILKKIGFLIFILITSLILYDFFKT
ncbi:hypothetical protein [Psychroserpens sp. NJDZ02]|uniref:hypothetical protein n=1 Tax=Psychroserpens sp. NJDZ02 TaxID=2570561 RepID=UPI0010A8CC8D|nr:hypothetical protein [Psychroserpens sp. NJDZ02]QCE43133.1 hypothetical protein E9099_17480 [Psychroserpens sp. NJDZ02]